MAIANKTHWIGVFLLFLSAILLLVTTISSPVIGDIAILKVMLTNQTDIRHSSVTFGTFGYCVLDVPPDNSDQDWCGPKVIGYNPADIMAKIDHTSYSEIASGTSDGLTNVMVLHPIACAFAFIAFLVSLGSGIVGSLLGAIIAFLAWILTLVSVAVDFTLFGIIRSHVNNDGSGSKAHFGPAIWTLLAALITLFFGMIIVFFTCCSNRREKKKNRAVKHEEYQQQSRAPRRKKFGIF